MLCEVPLTKEQQDFAAEHHGLVYKFLNDNHLPENEFYDVVIFPYLKAVQDYCNSASAQKYSFSTIAIRQMKFRLYDYFRTQARRKRNTEVISIHLGLKKWMVHRPERNGGILRCQFRKWRIFWG